MLRVLGYALGLAWVLIIAPSVQAQTVPPLGFNITSLTFVGTGCRPGTVYYVLHSDKTAMTVSFSDFWAEAGPGVPISSARRQCQVSLGLSIPEGFALAVASVDYRTFYILDDKVSLTCRSTSYFAGHAEQAVAESTHVGPLNTDLLTFRALFSPTLFSSCVERNATLAVNNQIRMSNAGNPKGWGGPPEETWEDPLRLTFNFEWKGCA